MTLSGGVSGRLRAVAGGFACFMLAACQSAGEADVISPATTLFFNGDILTQDEAQPIAQAVAVREGRILAVGTLADVSAAAGRRAERRDLQGAALIPGFIDTHGHFAMMAQAASMANLQPPPAGGVRSIEELQQTLRTWHEAHPQAEWITGWGYDDSLLAERRHPTRADLDAVFPDNPVLLMHTSAHFAACNTLCLAAIGITPDTPDPEGGVIRREEDGRTPNGVLEEAALYFVFRNRPHPVESERLAGLEAVQAVYASHGITTVQEGAGLPQQIADMRTLAGQGGFYLDVVAYQMVSNGASIDADFPASRDYQDRFRLGGIKLVLDGSPQGRTAWLTRPYVSPPSGQGPDYAGYPIHTDESVETLLTQAYARDIQVLAHANGDRAIDQMLEALDTVRADASEKDTRPVIIHAQTARQDQLEKMVQAKVIPSFFAAHPFFWGDWHRDQVLGEARAAFISPLASARSLGLPYTIHNDSPVVPPDMLRLIWVAVNRETRSGEILGEGQRASAADALRAVTRDAAYQYFEEDEKGSITPGKRADLVILSANPLTVPPEEIANISVVETLKDGVTIYRADQRWQDGQ